MNDADTLLETVINHPDDDYPRLVYADWLEEYGQPERAEFIRVQCELATIDKRHSDWPRLKALEIALLEAHSKEWLEPFRPYWEKSAENLEYRCNFVRGFVEELPLTSRGLLRHGTAIFKLSPIRGLTLVDTAGKEKELSQCSLLGQLQTICLYSHNLADVDLQPLLCSPYLIHLRSIELNADRFDEHNLKCLVDSGLLARLEHLTLLGYCSLSAIETVARNLTSRSLCSLGVSHTHCGLDGFRVMAESPNLADLRTLHLGFDQPGPRFGESLACSPHLTKLRELSLIEDQIGDDSLVALAGSENMCWLESLYVYDCDITATGLRTLVRSPHLGQILDLNLCCNRIGDEGAELLASSPKFSQLVSLEAARCRFTDEGVKTLARSTNCRRLVSLNLAGNCITDEGAMALLESPNLNHLAVLDLEYNQLSHRAVQTLRHRFGRGLQFERPPSPEAQ